MSKPPTVQLGFTLGAGSFTQEGVNSSEAVSFADFGVTSDRAVSASVRKSLRGLSSSVQRRVKQPIQGAATPSRPRPPPQTKGSRARPSAQCKRD